MDNCSLISSTVRYSKGSRKKIFYLVAGPLLEKRKFQEKNVTTKCEGEGVARALVARPLKKITFLRLPKFIYYLVHTNFQPTKRFASAELVNISWLQFGPVLKPPKQIKINERGKFLLYKL